MGGWKVKKEEKSNTLKEKLWQETKMLWGIKMNKKQTKNTKHSWNQEGKKRTKHSLKKQEYEKEAQWKVIVVKR